jgi:hypothetical protein
MVQCMSSLTIVEQFHEKPLGNQWDILDIATFFATDLPNVCKLNSWELSHMEQEVAHF